MSSLLAQFELTVAGYARLFGGQLDEEVRAVLSEGVGASPEGDWAAVFAYARYPDGTVEKVTIFTCEAGYAQRLAGAAGGRLPLPMATLQQRFPKVRPGWVIDDGDPPDASPPCGADTTEPGDLTDQVPAPALLPAPGAARATAAGPRRRTRPRRRLRRW